MKITTVEYNVSTGEEIIKEIELTEEEVAEMDKQQRASEIQRRLQDIIAELQKTDYKAIKFAEGIYTEEEYAETKLVRQNLRDEYNALEAELQGLN